MSDGRMTARLRRIGVRSTFLLFLVLFALVGLLVGTGLAVLSDLPIGSEAAETYLDRLGWWAPPIFALLYGILGGVAGAFSAVLYNVGAAVMGGVKVTLNTAHEVEVVPYHHRERVETSVADTPEPDDEGERSEPGATEPAGEGGGEPETTASDA